MSATRTHRVAALLEAGLRELQKGRVEEARQSCDRALELQPGHPDALHLRGVIALQGGDHARAVQWLKRAVSIRPDDPTFLANLAYGCIGLNLPGDALVAFERAARLAPGDPELQLGWGNCLGMMGRVEEAEGVLRRLIERHPRNALGWFNLAKTVDEQKRYEEACELYARAVQIAPRYAEAFNNLGVALNRLERAEEAERAFSACLALRPDFAPARVNLAISLNHLRRNAEAEALCRQALAQNPGQSGAHAVLALALSGQGRWREAMRFFVEALKEDPENAELLGYYAHALARGGSTQAALEAFNRALARNPADREARFNMAIALLDAGRVCEGMAEYFPREDNLMFLKRHPDRSLTCELPDDLRGREICLIREQGIGDEIFFLRYLPRLKARGCRVTYHGSRKIVSILARSRELDRVLADAEPYAAADHTVFVGDLAHLLGPSESSPFHGHYPSPGPWRRAENPDQGFAWHCRVFWPALPAPLPLRPASDKLAEVTERLRQLGTAPYIGLTWRAGTDPQAQRGRILQLYKDAPFEALSAALRGVPGTLISVQRNPGEGETARLAALLGRPVHDFSSANDDLEQMLALLALLDEYVGVSNTNVHLRASVGRTARVLVPWPAEWRWMIRGEESPWFPGSRIYRQSADGGWGNALTRLASDLRERG